MIAEQLGKLITKVRACVTQYLRAYSWIRRSLARSDCLTLTVVSGVHHRKRPGSTYCRHLYRSCRATTCGVRGMDGKRHRRRYSSA